MGNGVLFKRNDYSKEELTADLDPELVQSYSDLPESVVVSEIRRVSEEINQDYQDQAIVADTVDALESLAIHVAQLPEELDSNHQGMIRSALSMAVAGTPISVEQLVPSLESFSSRQVALEGITDTITIMVDSLFNSNKKILAKSQQREELYSTQYGRIKKAVDKLYGSIRGSRAKSISIPVYLAKAIKGHFGVITSKEEFFTTYEHDTNMIMDVLETVMANSLAIDGMMKKTIASFRTPSAYKEALAENYSKVRNDFLSKIAENKYFSRVKTEGYASEYLMGYRKFGIGLPDAESIEGMDDTSITTAIDKLSFSTIEDTIPREDWVGKRVEFEEVTIQDVERFVKELRSMLDKLERFISSEARAIKNRRNLIAALVEAAGAIAVGFKGAGIGAATGAGVAIGAGAFAGMGAATGAISGTAATLTAAGGLAAGLGIAGAGAVAGVKLGSALSKGAMNLGMWTLGMLSNSIRLHNKTSQLFNNATDGVVTTLTDHINIGYGVLEKVSKEMR